LCLVLLAASPGQAQIKFVTPLSGIPFEDWVIGNYNDVDTRPVASSDFRGGRYVYDGHDALDIGLAHFRKMDEGIDVLAAAGGTVISALDGFDDRHSPSNPNPGEVGNQLVVDHGNGIVTLYAHLKKNSLEVGIGDTVTAGQVIGQVGSSGNSSGPHLHFSVRQNGQTVETYLDPDAWWYDPLPYTGDVAGVLDSGIANHWPGQIEIEDGVENLPVFYASDGPGQLAVMYNYFYGIPVGANVSLLFRRPNGNVLVNYQWIDQFGSTVGFWNHGVQLPNVPDLGVWNAELRVNGDLISSNSFRVLESVPEPATSTAMILLAVLGMGFRRSQRAAKLR
jgi:murein DD-endopeptidase MepM/ murein hydrolase activator NlpD